MATMVSWVTAILVKKADYKQRMSAHPCSMVACLEQCQEWMALAILAEIEWTVGMISPERWADLKRMKSWLLRL